MNKENNRPYLWLIPVVLAMVGVIVLLSIFIRRSESQKSLPPYLYKLENIFSRRLNQPIASKDISLVRYWMTFDYINRVFDLPPEYLATALNVSDPRYPYVTLTHYARGEKISPNRLLNEVQAAVFNYLSLKK